MAKVTIQIEDIEEGIDVKISSDPSYPGPDSTKEQRDALTDAQQLGLRITQILTQELAGEHECGENCEHEHG